MFAESIRHAPCRPPRTRFRLRQAIAFVDANPVSAGPRPVCCRRPIPAAGSLRSAQTLRNWAVDLRQAELMVGAPRKAALYSSSAITRNPFTCFAPSRISPFKLPWILQWLGPAKFDMFFRPTGRGNQFSAAPVDSRRENQLQTNAPIWNLVSAARWKWGEWGGPLTLRALWNSYNQFSTASTMKLRQNDPGKTYRRILIFSYRVPFVRNWMTLYADSLADDDPSPLAAPRRAGVSPGDFTFPRIPGNTEAGTPRGGCLHRYAHVQKQPRAVHLLRWGFYHRPLPPTRKTSSEAGSGEKVRGFKPGASTRSNARKQYPVRIPARPGSASDFISPRRER